MKKLNLENLTLLGIVAGILAGLWMPPLSMKLAMLGEIFLRFLKMVVVPLVFAAVFVAVATPEDRGDLKRLGGLTFLYYLTTTALAVLTGLVLVSILRPGASSSVHGPAPQLPQQTVSGILLSLVPTNIFRSLTEGNALQIIVFALLLGGDPEAFEPSP